MVEASAGSEIQIGGPDVLTYGEMLDRMAEVLGIRRRPRIPVPLITPWLSSLWIGLVTPVDAGVARPLIEGLAVPTVVTDRSGMALFDIEPITFDEALRRAVAEDPELPAGARPSLTGPHDGTGNREPQPARQGDAPEVVRERGGEPDGAAACARSYGQGDGSGGILARRGQRVRLDQRDAVGGHRRAGVRAADPDLSLADLLGDPALQRADGGGLLAVLRMGDRRGEGHRQRPERRRPARARIRCGHRLRAAACRALPRGAAPLRAPGRRNAPSATPGRTRGVRVGVDGHPGAAVPVAGAGQRHQRARTDRRDGSGTGDALDADPAAGGARGRRPARLLAVRAALRLRGHGRNARDMALRHGTGCCAGWR